jgi:hypothetical protein
MLRCVQGFSGTLFFFAAKKHTKTVFVCLQIEKTGLPMRAGL